MQSCSSATDFSQAFQMHTNRSPEDLPFGCEQSKRHLNSHPWLAQTEVACSVGGNMLHCSAEWNDDFVGQWMSIVSCKETFVWQTINPLPQFNATIERPCIIGSAWTNHTKVNESKVCIDNSLDIHSMSLVVPTEVVS